MNAFIHGYLVRTECAFGYLKLRKHGMMRVIIVDLLEMNSIWRIFWTRNKTLGFPIRCLRVYIFGLEGTIWKSKISMNGRQTAIEYHTSIGTRVSPIKATAGIVLWFFQRINNGTTIIAPVVIIISVKSTFSYKTYTFKWIQESFLQCQLNIFDLYYKFIF